MRRADRLLQIIQILRRQDRPIAATAIARELEVSLRTIYRDMASLESTGVPLRGEAGVGYVLDAGFDMPPLMFSESELEALMLGARLLDGRVDDQLSLAARDAVAKIATGLPEHLREALIDTPLFAPQFVKPEPLAVDMADIRRALRQERQVLLHYRDLKGAKSERVVWPVMISIFNAATLLAAWCTTRDDFRSFRLDGVTHFEVLEVRLPKPRKTLFAEWKKTPTAKYRDPDFARERGGELRGI